MGPQQQLRGVQLPSQVATGGCREQTAARQHFSKCKHKHKGNNTCEVMVISQQFTASMFLPSKVVAEIARVRVFLFTPTLSDVGGRKKKTETLTPSDKDPSDDVTSSTFDVKSSAAHGRL